MVLVVGAFSNLDIYPDLYFDCFNRLLGVEMNITKEMIQAFANSLYGIKGPQMVIEIGPEIEAALKAAIGEPENYWLAINDAPKDGMTVDLWNSITEERRADARFINGKWRVWGQDGFDNMGWVAAEHQDGFTHFMHLPSSPPSSEIAQ